MYTYNLYEVYVGCVGVGDVLHAIYIRIQCRVTADTPSVPTLSSPL